MTDRVLRYLKHLLGVLLVGCRVHRWFLREKAIIVTFHTVSDRVDDSPIRVSMEKFRSYCQVFARHFHVVSLESLLEDLRNGGRIGNKLVITFDDGYRDNYTCAAPMLERYRLPATFFVATNFIGTSKVPWWDEDLPDDPEWMDWNHVVNLHSRGFEVGGHTMNHVRLSGVSSDEARGEIMGARKTLEMRLEVRQRHFAYPYGGAEDIDDEKRAIVKEAGYESCASCFGGVVTPDSSPMELRRIPINNWYKSPYEFVLDIVRDANTHRTAERPGPV